MALAIFVKTPGLTPTKTRLAAGVGQATADAFYQRTLDITEDVARAAAATDSALQPYWAVTEAAAVGHDRWRGLPQLWQGEGGLGARLDRVYRELLQRHGAVLLIGADSPLLTSRHLGCAREMLASEARECVMGRALDGGFYLFGGTVPMARELWTSVSYSEADTADQLLALLEPAYRVGQLTPLPDVDTVADLLAIPAHAATAQGLLPSQRALLSWIRELVPG
ncbi:MAG: DUF2064 domain-containing protein [Gemmatimonadales bacterium]